MRDFISILIPVYFSEKSLNLLYDRLINVMDSIDVDYEIVMVNDGSTDDSWKIISELSEKDKRVVGVNLMRNSGQHTALLCGMNYCKGDYVVTIDDDLQNPPEEIKRMYEYIKSKPALDVLIGVPDEPQKSIVKNLGSILLNRMVSHILGKPKDLKMASFRIMRKVLVENLCKNKTKTPAIGAMLFKYTKSIENIVVQHDPRFYGKSGYSFKASVKLFSNYIINFSRLPLRWMISVGFSTAVIGFVLILYYLFRYFIGSVTVPGWTTMVVLLLILGGLILSSLGIIGEYIYSILDRSSP